MLLTVVVENENITVLDRGEQLSDMCKECEERMNFRGSWIVHRVKVFVWALRVRLRAVQVHERHLVLVLFHQGVLIIF